jgi:hypothetical protein
MPIKMKVAITALVCVFASLLTVGPAAAVTCYGSTCDGKSPQTSGCSSSGAYEISSATVYTAGDGPATGHLMYTDACHAFWVRGQSLGSATAYGADYQIRIVKKTISTDQLVYRDTVTVGSNQAGPSGYEWNFTAMAGRHSDRKIRGCVGFNGNWSCTGWFSN